MANDKSGMNKSQPGKISFELEPEAAKAIEQLAGTRKVRLSGQIRKGKLVVDHASFADEGQAFPGASGAFVAVNAPFLTKQLSEAQA